MLKAIKQIRAHGYYPSAARINQMLGRKTQSLNGDECAYRRQVFRDLGIALKGPRLF